MPPTGQRCCRTGNRVRGWGQPSPSSLPSPSPVKPAVAPATPAPQPHGVWGLAQALRLPTGGAPPPHCCHMEPPGSQAAPGSHLPRLAQGSKNPPEIQSWPGPRERGVPSSRPAVAPASVQVFPGRKRSRGQTNLPPDPPTPRPGGGDQIVAWQRQKEASPELTGPLGREGQGLNTPQSAL